MLGLRLIEEGVSREAFSERYGFDFSKIFEVQIKGLMANGLVEWAGLNRDALRLTKRGDCWEILFFENLWEWRSQNPSLKISKR